MPLKLSNNMNNFRLSSYIGAKDIITAACHPDYVVLPDFVGGRSPAILPAILRYKAGGGRSPSEEIKMLLNADPMTIPLSDGRLLNLITQKLDSSIKGGSVFEIVNSDSGEVILANSL